MWQWRGSSYISDSHWNWTSQRMIQVHGVSLAWVPKSWVNICIPSYSAHSIGKTGDGLEQELCTSTFQQALSQSWNLTVLLFQGMYIHCLDGLANLVMHMMIHYMYSAWLNIWSTAILPRLQGTSLCGAAPPILSHGWPCVKKLCYLTENTWKERHARLLYKVTHCTGGFPANTRPWMDFHQWQHLLHGEWWVAAACTLLHRPAHVSHDSGHAELVWVVRMYTRFATLLLAFLIPLPSQCNTLKPVLDWSDSPIFTIPSFAPRILPRKMVWGYNTSEDCSATTFLVF